MAFGPTMLYPRAVVQIAALLDNQLGIAIPVDLTVVPKSVVLHRNTARRADTATVELDYSDFPLDPRLFQDALVSVYLESLPTPTSPMLARPIALGPALPSNMRFVGLVDEPRTNLGSGGNTVSLPCRDFTGVFLDFKWAYGIGAPGAPPVATLKTPPGTPLSLLIEQIRVAVAPETDPAIFLDPSTAALDVGSRTGKAAFVGEDNDSAWDAMCRLCDLFGLIPVWNLDQLEIRTASLPTGGGALMIYGANIERLEFSRDLRRQKATQVKVVAWNPVLGQSFEAIWPPDADAIKAGAAKIPKRVTKATTSPKITIKQVQYDVSGNYTPADVLALAIAIWSESRQHVLAGQLETRETQDFLTGDLLALQNGDQLVCQLGPDDLSSIASMTIGEAIAFLSNPDRANPMSPDAAAIVANAYSQVQNLSVTFFVTEVEHHWTRDDGYKLVIRFRDFALGV